MKNKFKIGILVIVVAITAPLLLGCTSRRHSEADLYQTITKCLEENSADNQIQIKYPQIESKDRDLTKVNQTIENAAYQLLKHYFTDGYNVAQNTNPGDFVWNWSTSPYNYAALEVNFKITLLNAEVASIVFEGMFNRETAAHPISVFETANINLENGELIMLNDVYSVDDGFFEIYLSHLKAFCQENYPSEQWLEIYEYVEQDESFKENFILADTGEGISSYFTESGVGISYPVIFALGDHIEVVIPYEEIAEYVK
ncbi:MAG: hypothetical protein LBO63_00240 [Oscillospiraceae bacterium]|jgi:hypothetical protein|nr:hypothetical protein [Oscillospiraceae bacterium]